jgi:hypothetical protein
MIALNQIQYAAQKISLDSPTCLSKIHVTCYFTKIMLFIISYNCRSKDETASTETMLQAEKRAHDTTKQTLFEFQQKNELLQRKVDDSDKRIVDLQSNVQRFIFVGFGCTTYQTFNNF